MAVCFDFSHLGTCDRYHCPFRHINSETPLAIVQSLQSRRLQSKRPPGKLASFVSKMGKCFKPRRSKAAALERSTSGVHAVSAAVRQTKTSSIHLSNKSMADGAARKLAGILSMNSNAEVLSLDHNQIGDAGAFFLADALRKHESIRAVDLMKNVKLDLTPS